MAKNAHQIIVNYSNQLLIITQNNEQINYLNDNINQSDIGDDMIPF